MFRIVWKCSESTPKVASKLLSQNFAKFQLAPHSNSTLTFQKNNLINPAGFNPENTVLMYCKKYLKISSVYCNNTWNTSTEHTYHMRIENVTHSIVVILQCLFPSWVSHANECSNFLGRINKNCFGF